MARTMDMTHGRPARLILTFALPMLLSSMFQQFYGMVDTIVVGRGVGVNALAAVGATTSLNFFIIGFTSGLTYGFGMLFAQRFGAGDHDGLRRAAASSLSLSLLIGAVVTLLSVFGANLMLTVLKTPEDIFADAALYITIIFAAIPVTILFNLLSAMLRSVGDSKTPLIAMLLSSALNIALDLLFVYSLHMGILGVAIATDLAQILSCAVCWLGVQKTGAFVLTRTDFSHNHTLSMQLLRLGIPVACMNSITAVGGMLLQTVVNGFGSTYVAGYTAAKKLMNFLEEPGVMLGWALSVYTGQNLGAQRVDRIKNGTRAAILIALILNGAMALIMYFGREPLVRLFVQESEAEAVLPISGMMLTVMSLFMCVLGLLFIYRNALQGLGDTTTPMLSGALELVLRMSLALLLAQRLHFLGVCIAEVGAWTGAAILLCVVYYVRINKMRPTDQKNSYIDSITE